MFQCNLSPFNQNSGDIQLNKKENPILQDQLFIVVIAAFP